MATYYEPPQWSPAGQTGWEHQTPPPARSGANSAIPREESAAFGHQLEEVDRAIDNLFKSGKMFGGGSGGRRESLPKPGPARKYPDFDGRMVGGPGPRPHSATDFGDARGPHPSSNLQNFYAAQRHQSSRGSNEAEQMMQAKRRMAAQRERELRNYHQEQQYNRTVLAELATPYSNPKSDRSLSPGNISEEDRRKLISQQQSALYGEGSFSKTGGYVDETGAPRQAPAGGPPNGPAALRGSYEYAAHSEASPQTPVEAAQGSQSAGQNERSRANSNSSPQSNPSGSKGAFDIPVAHQSSRTSASSPGGSPPRQSAPGTKPGQGSVAPIGTRPSVSSAPPNPALSKRSTTPLPSPLSQGYTPLGNEEGGAAPSNPSAATDGPNMGLSGWGPRPTGWGGKSGLGVQASVWG
ncbi:hypothetical protein B0T26DRAFT_745803 [Lasiosphaeria miniovina]|uniref:Uncharacterized protein n=1 Tax=Lasiosphaeria miniovina TaxID=1954250 RepID=A0AA40EBE8_9PEZI|nr:uncharacterized protein B0T26DRAFT_745803 [Lasiosphaeria miniovina]KAK0733805.1 hypothetical protein B0T26DRAFT_745803 [Lasiosphaeria miniovina]